MTLSHHNETSPVKQSTSLVADLSCFIYCDTELNKLSCDGCLDIQDMEMHPSELNALCDYFCRATQHEGRGCSDRQALQHMNDDLQPSGKGARQRKASPRI